MDRVLELRLIEELLGLREAKTHFLDQAAHAKCFDISTIRRFAGVRAFIFEVRATTGPTSFCDRALALALSLGPTFSFALTFCFPLGSLAFALSLCGQLGAMWPFFLHM